MPEWLEAGYPHTWLPYTQMKTTPVPMPVVRSEGVRLTLADGRELIDGTSSWWTACHGYNHPHIRSKVQAQLETMPHVMFGGLAHEPALTLCRRLAEKTPGDLAHTFLCESGSVSVEIGMKMAAQYWINKGTRGRTRFVCFRDGYHGDTLATMSVCDPEEGMHSLFKGMLFEQIVTDLPRSGAQLEDFRQLLRRQKDEIAAVVMEPLAQGAGGMIFHSAEVLRDVAQACAEEGVLLIVDEIMTGFGRTGTLFACERAGIVPDIMTLSKALTGGTLPLAATIARPHVFDAFLSDDPEAALMHGPTYMANALGCAAANGSLDLFETEPRLQQVAKIESALTDLLAPARKIAGVKDVRVMGAIGVIELEEMRGVDWFKQRFVEEGVWVRPFRNIVYTTPPFVMGEADLARLGETMVRVVDEWARSF